MSKGLIFSALLAAAAGCSQAPTIPKIGDQPVKLTITASSRSFKIGTPDTLRVSITNTLAQSVRLQYSNDCQLEMFVRDAKGNIVIPVTGKSQCLPINTTLTLPANGSVLRVFVWTGGTAFLPTVTSDHVAPGTYYISGEINALNYSTILPALKVDVTQ